MSIITENLKTFLHLGTQINFFNTVILTYRDNEEYLNKVKLPGFYSDAPFTKAVSGFLQNYQIIIICSLLDEFDKQFIPLKYPEHSEKILKVKEITKPIKKRINKWKDLKNYRNYILAHNLREKDISIFSEKYTKKTYKIPYSNSEHYLLGELAILIINFTTEVFKNEVEKIDLTENFLSRIEFEFNDIDSDKELFTIYSECLKLLNNCD